MNREASKAVPVVFRGIAAIALLFAAHLILQPVPVPTATAVLGGLLALGSARGWRPLGVGIVTGLLAGVGHHLYVHLSAQSPRPPEGLAAHLAGDGALGGILALLILAALLLLDRVLPGGSAGPPR